MFSIALSCVPSLFIQHHPCSITIVSQGQCHNDSSVKSTAPPGMIQQRYCNKLNNSHGHRLTKTLTIPNFQDLQDKSWLQLKYFWHFFLGCQYFVYSTMLISSAWQNRVLISLLETHRSLGTTFFPSVCRITYLIYVSASFLFTLSLHRPLFFTAVFLSFTLSPFVSFNQPSCLLCITFHCLIFLTILLSCLMVQYFLSSAAFLLESFFFPLLL